MVDQPRAGRTLADVMRPAVWCAETDRVREAAERIGAAGVSCALVSTSEGLGIVTDLDFRRRVATGQVGADAPVGALATVPALTSGAGDDQTVGLLRMVEHGVHHLVVVDPVGRPVGVARAVDLAGSTVRDPLAVRTAVATADDLDHLAAAARRLPAALLALADDGVAAAQVSAVQAAVLDATIRRALHLRGQPDPAGPPVGWVVLGSLARREPLPLSDVDTALVWADPAGDDPTLAERVRAGARAVLDDLVRCGLTLCANGANADDPRFSRSRSAWLAAAQGWQDDPTQTYALLLSAVVADSRPLTNPALGRSLTAAIRSHTRTPWFLRALLEEALRWRPPTGVLRDFLVAHGGEHRGQLDLKAGGLVPIVALARWIAVAAGDAGGTTVERLRRGAALGLLTADEADTLAGGFEHIHGLLCHRELAALRSGGAPSTYLAPDELDTLTRRHLRETFRAVALVQSRVDRAWMVRLSGSADRPHRSRPGQVEGPDPDGKADPDPVNVVT
jgi:CBS domain-containing protein